MKLHPSTSWNNSPSAYIEMPEENIVMTAKLTALKALVFSSKRNLRYSGTERALLP